MGGGEGRRHGITNYIGTDLTLRKRKLYSSDALITYKNNRDVVLTVVAFITYTQQQLTCLSIVKEKSKSLRETSD